MIAQPVGLIKLHELGWRKRGVHRDGYRSSGGVNIDLRLLRGPFPHVLPAERVEHHVLQLLLESQVLQVLRLLGMEGRCLQI